MRIRKSASRLLGSAYAASAAPAPDVAPPFDLQTPAPPPYPPPCSAPESRGWSGLSSSATASGEACELSRSPWDLIAELSLSDPQEEDDLVDKYFVHVTTRASWLFSPTIPATSSKKKKPAAASRDDRTLLQHEPVKKAPKKAGMNKEGDAKKKGKVKKEEGRQGGGAQQVWKCKKNDGKRWHCHRTVSQPNTLCAYHFVQKRSYLNPDFELPASSVESEEAAPLPSVDSKPSTSKKPRKKKPSSDFSATEGFYYYAGFGPFRSKKQCRSGGMNEPIPAKQQEEEEEEEEPPKDASHHADQEVAEAAEDNTNQAAPHDDVSSYDDNDDIAGIAGVDEESSDEDYDGIGIPGHGMSGNGDPQASSGDSKRKNRWKRWRKPVKARSLKSLM
ncbi:hypothetical protein BS78_01G220800 [Paspalum vaginatum]|nr:hypothetical protein BS78_01G220800 [Paspalum vaginatum]